MLMHEKTIVPTLRTVGWTGSSISPRDTWHGRKIFSLSFSSGELHWQFPDSSTKDRFLSVLKNNVSDTRGTELLLQKISQGFLFEQFLRTSELIFLNPSNSAVFSYDSRNIKVLTKTTLQLLLLLELPQDGARLSQGRLDASGSRFLRISHLGILQEDTNFFNVPQ